MLAIVDAFAGEFAARSSSAGPSLRPDYYPTAFIYVIENKALNEYTTVLETKLPNNICRCSLYGLKRSQRDAMARIDY
jgi:hypothetical protein